MEHIDIHYAGISVDGKYISQKELQAMNTKFSHNMLREIRIKRKAYEIRRLYPWKLKDEKDKLDSHSLHKPTLYQ